MKALRSVVWAALACMIIAGCGHQQQPLDAGSQSPNQWDPTAWKPPHPYVAPPVDATEVARRAEVTLRGIRRQFDLPDDTPRPALVRYVTFHEMAREVPACMAAQGWPQVRTSSNGTGIAYDEPPAAQRHTFGLAMYRCHAQYLPDPRLVGELTDGLMGQQWDFVTTYLIPCLAAHGYSNLEPPPSREVFSSEKKAWAGYPPALTTGSAGDAADAAVACPQNVPESILLGE